MIEVVKSVRFAPDLALQARVALAFSRVMRNAYFYRQQAEHLALSCGYHTHPDNYVSPLISDDHVLFMAWIEGWNQRETEVQVLAA